MKGAMMKKVLLFLIVFGFVYSVSAIDLLKFHISNLRSTDMVTGPWMYDFDDPGLPTHDGNPFTLKPGPSNSHLYAFRNLDWATPATTSTLMVENLPFVTGSDVVTVTMEPYILTGFNHINTVLPIAPWTIYGQAGDRRDYTTGICHFYVNSVEKMRLVDCKIVAISPYQNASQIRVILTALGIPGAAGWQMNVGSGGAVVVGGWGYLDPAHTDAQWQTAFANPYGNQVFMDFSNTSYVFGTPYGWYTFDVNIRPAYHQECIATEEIPAGNNVDVIIPEANVATHFNTAVSGGATEQLRGYTVNEVLEFPGGNYPPEILTKATKYWQLSTTLSSFNADITFDVTGQALKNPAAWRILSRPFYSTDWVIYPTISVVDANHIKALGVTSFSEWTVGSIEGTLPVELSSFTATAAAQLFVSLQWTTESETNNLGFNIYRSSDSFASNAIKLNQGMIAGTNTSVQHSYNFTDPEVESGATYYYWLESVDFNGTGHFSNYVTVTVSGNSIPNVPTVTALKNAYPNPFRVNSATHIGFDVKEGEAAKLTIYNIRGQVIKSYVRFTGNQLVSWNGCDNQGKSCVAGVYLYKLISPSISVTKKILLTQ
jgi:hypothetical protein